MQEIRFRQPDLRTRHFDVEKARAWELRHGYDFPYRPGQLVYVLVESWSISWVEDGQRWRMTIPKGFVSDLSSVPWFARSIVDRVSMGEAAPLFHDVPYRFRGYPPAGWVEVWSRGAWVPSRRLFSRAWTDRAFRLIQAADHRPGWVQTVSWLAVRTNLLAGLRWLREIPA